MPDNADEPVHPAQWYVTGDAEWDAAGRCTECWYWKPNHLYTCSRSPHGEAGRDSNAQTLIPGL